MDCGKVWLSGGKKIFLFFSSKAGPFPWRFAFYEKSPVCLGPRL